MPLTVVGLGPGPVEWVSAAGRDALRREGARVYLRTRVHPAVGALLDGIAHESFDSLYQQAPTVAALNEAIAERLVQAAGGGTDVVYGVPGDGMLGEAALAALTLRGAEIRIIPGVPHAGAALAAAKVAGEDGAQIIEATALGGSGLELHVELNPRWPAVVTGVFSRQVAGDLKLALLRVYPDGHAVQIVRHPGLPDEAVTQAIVADLDRGAVEYDHLTHVVIASVRVGAPTGSAHGLRALISRLRAPEVGCPWDLEQTHRSLIPFVIEETYEVVEAIEEGHPAALLEELGDLLLQVVLHAELADQDGHFELNDVVRAISAKLIRRHPHVFGDVHVEGASDVVRNWDQLKAAERADVPRPASALEGVPKSLPALKQAAELGRRAVKAGFNWPDRSGAVDKVHEELRELLEADSLEARKEEFGDLLWMLANLAQRDGIDPELALRAASRKFVGRFEELEQLARERDWDGLKGRSTRDLLEGWAEAKRRASVLPPSGE